MKMMPVVIGVLVAWVMVICAGNVTAEEIVQRDYAISDVQRLKIQGAGEMTLELGSEESLQVIAPRSVLERLKVDGQGSDLRIRQKGQWFWQSDETPVQYKLVMRSLEGLEVTGALAIAIKGPVTADKLVIRATGASGMRFDDTLECDALDARLTGAGELHMPRLHARHLDIRATGAANISVAGEVESQELHFNGASEYHAAELKSESAELNFSGASESIIRAEKQLSASLSGAATVRYHGSPAVEKRLSGASELFSIDK